MSVDERFEVYFFDPLRDVGVAINFMGQIQAQSTHLGSHDIR